MHASDNSGQINSNNFEARQQNADKLGKYEKSNHPQEACPLTKSSEEEERPGRQNQPSQVILLKAPPKLGAWEEKLERHRLLRFYS